MKITCKNIREFFLKYYERKLPPDLDDKVIEHLAQCKICSDKYDQWLNQKLKESKSK